MGSFDSSVTCELIGIHLLRELNKIIDKNDRGLYRDDVIIPRIFSKKKTRKNSQNQKNNHKNFQKYEVWDRHKNYPKSIFPRFSIKLKKGYISTIHIA